MTSQIAYPHIETVEGQDPRLMRFPRIRVAQIVMDYLAYGWSVDEMYRQHPYLQLSEIHAAMGYYFDHQEEIDREIEAEWKLAIAERFASVPSKFVLRMKARGLI
jgi:uncharacterized protein (DUF433 family)